MIAVLVSFSFFTSTCIVNNYNYSIHPYMDAAVEDVRNKINATAIKIFLVIYVVFCSVISNTSIICVYIVSVLSIVCSVASSYSLY